MRVYKRGESAGFSFDVSGRSTILPIPAALQTRLLREESGGATLFGPSQGLLSFGLCHIIC